MTRRCRWVRKASWPGDLRRSSLAVLFCTFLCGGPPGPPSVSRQRPAHWAAPHQNQGLLCSGESVAPPVLVGGVSPPLAVFVDELVQRRRGRRWVTLVGRKRVEQWPGIRGRRFE